MTIAETVERLRAVLAEDPDSVDWSALAPGVDAPGLAGLPGRLGEVLAVTDGPWCGKVEFFRFGDLAKGQRSVEEIGDPADWLCFATRAQDPMFIHRATGAVWWFDAVGSDRFDVEATVLADDVPTFFTEYVCGPGYQRIAREDYWYGVLRRAGLMPG